MSCSLIDRPLRSIFERQLFPVKKKIGFKSYAEFKATKKNFKFRFYNATCLDETLINNNDLQNWYYTSPDSICSFAFIQYFQLNPQ